MEIKASFNLQEQRELKSIVTQKVILRSIW